MLASLFEAQLNQTRAAPPPHRVERLRLPQVELLEESGYVVMSANGGEEAISFATRHKARIDLLITDVVMPKISGKEVAEQLKTIHPETRVLFMSGYTDEAIVHHGIR